MPLLLSCPSAHGIYLYSTRSDRFTVARPAGILDWLLSQAASPDRARIQEDSTWPGDIIALLGRILRVEYGCRRPRRDHRRWRGVPIKHWTIQNLGGPARLLWGYARHGKRKMSHLAQSPSIRIVWWSVVIFRADRVTLNFELVMQASTHVVMWSGCKCYVT